MRKWKVHWYVWITDQDGEEDRRHRSKVIGRAPRKDETVPVSVSDASLPVMTRAEAQAELDRIISIEAGGRSTRRDGSITFGKFWREQWLPLRESTWRPHTRVTNLAVIETHLEPRWGNVQLDAIDLVKASAWLGKIAETFSSSLVYKARTYLRSIVAEAVEQGYLPKDPLRRLKRPRVAKKKDASYLTAEQVQAIRGEMENFRDRLILDILLATGMRPGELFALRWGDLRDGALYVDEGFTKGRLEEPKTASSIAAVAVPAEIMERIALLQREAEPASQQEFVFPSGAGTPIHSENWRKRVLYPAARRAGLRVTFQVIRRTVATLSLQAGVPVKAVQAQLRHASADTTMNVYAQIVTAAQGEASEAMFRIMQGKGAKPDDKT